MVSPRARLLVRGGAHRSDGLPALGVYKREGERFVPYALQALALDGDLVRGLTAFLDTRWFAAFGFAPEL